MDTQATNLEHAENDLKQLMDDVSRAMHKAQEAVARITAGEMSTTVPDRVAETLLPPRNP
jgi:flagellar hook-basal body complex protein FliE